MADYRVDMVDYRAAVSAIVTSFAFVRVSEPTAWLSMALCPVSLALPPPGIIPTQPPMVSPPVDNFVSTIIGFAAMMKHFIIAG
jgi:hypothetical protein